MRKQEFLDALERELARLPQKEVEERLAFYEEMIDDRIEDGLAEEDAVAAIGSVREITEQIIADIPLARLAKEKIKPKRKMKTWEIVLLTVGSLVWIPLGISAVAVILSLYVVLWALVVTVWAVFVALAACGAGGTVASICFALGGNGLVGLVVLGAGLVSAGLAILLFFGFLAATKGIAWLTKKITLGIKKAFVK